MNSLDTNQEAPACLRFLNGWQTTQHGTIRQGRQLVIDYDPWRLPDLRKDFRDVIAWNVEAFVRFHPGGQLYTASVLEDIAQGGHGPVRDHRAKSFQVVVPQRASRVEFVVSFRSWCFRRSSSRMGQSVRPKLLV
jgi:hypothetical protein